MFLGSEWGMLRRGPREMNPELSLSELRAYRLGCAKRILSMTSELKKHRIELGGEPVQALVRIGQGVAKRHIASMKMGQPHRVDSRIYASDNEAYSKGFDDGSRVDIHGAQSSKMLEG